MLKVRCHILGAKWDLVKKIIYAIRIHSHSPWSLFNSSLFFVNIIYITYNIVEH